MPSLGAPQPKLDVLGSRTEIIVRAEKDKVVFEAELYQQGVNGSNLETVTPTSVADFGCFYMVVPIRLQEAKRAEPIDQLAMRFGARKPLKKFLQHKARSKDLVCPIESVRKRADFGRSSDSVAAKGERPDACIDE